MKKKMYAKLKQTCFRDILPTREQESAGVSDEKFVEERNDKTHTYTKKKSTGTVNREFLVYSSMSLYVHTNKSRTCVEFKWLVWYETLRGEGVWGWYVSPKTIFDFVTCCPATRPTPLLIRGDTNTPAGS